eukprot:TRINITY_DN174_c0_g1_i12.p1 TRINITY_DN174_c0_g1~~TRINITY_DN174_c0_g1_i12.p1  ORF type:complete len:322 (-),score=38.96 TRINITY_DN174_c0_g1_i12:84-1049(-)
MKVVTWAFALLFLATLASAKKHRSKSKSPIWVPATSHAECKKSHHQKTGSASQFCNTEGKKICLCRSEDNGKTWSHMCGICQLNFVVEEKEVAKDESSDKRPSKHKPDLSPHIPNKNKHKRFSSHRPSLWSKPSKTASKLKNIKPKHTIPNSHRKKFSKMSRHGKTKAFDNKPIKSNARKAFKKSLKKAVGKKPFKDGKIRGHFSHAMKKVMKKKPIKEHKIKERLSGKVPQAMKKAVKKKPIKKHKIRGHLSGKALRKAVGKKPVKKPTKKFKKRGHTMANISHAMEKAVGKKQSRSSRRRDYVNAQDHIRPTLQNTRIH